MPSPLPRQVRWNLFARTISINVGLPQLHGGSAPALHFSRPAQRSLTLWPARSPSRLATLYTESSDRFVASAVVSVATGRSEPVPGRELHPLKSSAFSRRTCNRDLPTNDLPNDLFVLVSSKPLRPVELNRQLLLHPGATHVQKNLCLLLCTSLYRSSYPVPGGQNSAVSCSIG